MMHRAKSGTNRQKDGTWRETEETFVNPYNFVCLGNGCRRFDIREYNSRDDLVTGYIECTLETKTPIFIPNPTNQNVLNHPGELKTLDFYSYKILDGSDNQPGLPVIPASEIRGVIRAAFEAVTDSCMSTVDVEQKLYKRTTICGNAGILKKDDKGYYIQKAKRERVWPEDCKEFNEGQLVYVKGEKDKNTGKYRPIVRAHPFKGGRPGYYHKGEFFDRKKYESVFIELKGDNNKIRLPADFDPIAYLKELIWLYNKNNNINQTDEHTGYIDYKNYINNKENEYILVYYRNHNGKFYLSPACISKELFYKRLHDILKKQGGYQPCTTQHEICPACALFGLASKQDRMASRLRFTDAKVCTRLPDVTEYYLPFKVLDELSNPKLSATEFYLENPGTDIWNYDYAANWDEKGKLRTIGGYEPKIRGRKFYWHSKGEPKWQDYRGKEDENLHKRNCAVRPLKRGIQFSFRIYFEQIAEDDLKRLIWTLNIGGNENSHCHKIGMGKPLGLGSVKIKVRQVKIRKIELLDDTISYKEVDVDYQPHKLEEVIDLNAKYVKEFLKITDMNEAKTNLSYPIAKNLTVEKNQDAIYHWFIGNRNLRSKSSMRPKVHRSLPEILDKNVELKALRCE